MADDGKYQLNIGAFSPKTMPLGRLLMYLEQFKKLLPHPDKVHLVDIYDGSVAPAFYIQPTYEAQTLKGFRDVSEGNCNADARKAFTEIQHLASEDSADGVRLLGPDGAKIIVFPVKPRPVVSDDLVVNGVKESATIFASAFKTGRQKSTSKKYDAWFTDIKNGKTIRAELPIDLGVRLGGLLEQVLSVSGMAEWNRDEEGKWAISKFEVQHFEEFHPRKLKDTFSLITKAEGSLPEDIHKRLDDYRNGS